jgi:hypothetical protein
MYEPITDSRQGVIKGGQNPDWFGGRLEFGRPYSPNFSK